MGGDVVAAVDHVDEPVVGGVHAREVGAQSVGQAPGHIGRDLGVTIIPAAHGGVGRKCRVRVARDDVYGTARGVATIQRPLRAFQDFDTRYIAELLN
jgi:hypothetical protein